MKYFLYLFLLLSSIVHSSAILHNDQNKYDNFTIHYHYDENSKLKIEEIQNLYFADTINNQFTLGYKYGTAWFKIELINNSDTEDFVLYFTESIWSKLDLYSKENGIWKVQENGLEVPLHVRNISDNAPAYKFHIPKNQTKILYLKGTSLSGIIGEVQIFTQEEYFKPTRTTITEFYIIYACIFFGMVILNLYNLIITRDSIYAYYIYYILSAIVFIAMKSGFYLSLGFHGWNEGLHVVGDLMLVFLLLFSKEFLELKTRMPNVEISFYIFATIFLILAILIGLNIPYASLALNLFSLVFLTTLFATAIRLLMLGYKSIRYYLVALLIYSICMGLMVMNFNTFLPNTDITRYAFLFGLFIEVLFFTLILTNRFVEANKQRILVQNELLEEKHNNEANLKAEINKQTKELSNTNTLLLKQKKDLEDVQIRLKKEATIDVLSGLYNRRYFFQEANKAFYTATRYEQELSIILIDIDHFKDINDKYGHIFGDEVIQFISETFKELARTSDTVARYGGEEFIILMPQSTKEEAILLAERIRVEVQKRTAKKFTIDNDITLSLGVTQIIDTDTDIERAIMRSNKGLYDAKNNGRNQVSSL